MIKDAGEAGIKTLVLGGLATPLANVHQGRLTATGPARNLITVDRWGNILEMADLRDPNWRITYQFNHDNQLTGQTQNALAGDTRAAKASTRYDALGRVAAQVDYNNNLNATTYDSQGNVAREYHADGGVVVSSYNLFGNRLSVKQPDTVLAATVTATGVLTAYAYDYLGQLIETSTGSAVDVHVATNAGKHFDWAPVSNRKLVQRFTYDELGRQIRITGADQVATVISYDMDGNVIATATQATPGADLLYRTVTAYNARHQKVATRDANDHTQSWRYADGRLQSSTDMAGAVTTYGYDQAGRLLTQTSTRGQSLRYTFTGANLTRIDDRATGMTTVYAHDAVGNRIRERQQTTVAAPGPAPERMQDNVITYDWQNRVTSVKDELYTVTYAYDGNGNRVTITNQYKYGPAPVVSYNAFDAMNRQTVVDGDLDAAGKPVFGSRGHAITYDLAGNRLSDTFKGVAVTYSGGRYRTTSETTTTERYTYDAAGRITQAGLLVKGDAGVTDTLGQLGIASSGRIYSYDAGGHITRQTELNADLKSAQDTYFVSDAWNPGAGYDAMGNLTGYTVVIPDTIGIWCLSLCWMNKNSYGDSCYTFAADATLDAGKAVVAGGVGVLGSIIASVGVGALGGSVVPGLGIAVGAVAGFATGIWAAVQFENQVYTRTNARQNFSGYLERQFK